MADDKNIKNQNENKKTEEKQDESSYGIALGMCFGIALGIIFGQFVLHNMIVGMCCGLSLGVGIGSVYDVSKRNKKSDGTGQEAASKQNAEAEPEEQKPESGEE